MGASQTKTGAPSDSIRLAIDDGLEAQLGAPVVGLGAFREMRATSGSSRWAHLERGAVLLF